MYPLLEFRPAFDPYLEQFLDQKIRSYEALTNDSSVRSYIAYTKQLALAHGKRVRPYLAYLMYKAAGGTKDNDALRLFVALELFHLFGLIHDDIIDHGKERHGVPTIHEYVTAELTTDGRLGDTAHVGAAHAILVGDLMFSWVTELLTTTQACAPEQRERLLYYFFRMSDEVLIGQMIDVDTTTRETVSKQRIEEKILLKTASYTFVRPMQIGMALANVSNELEKFCDELGRALGIAFQIQDDILDITADAATAKKTPLNDLRDRQHTYLTQYIREHGTPDQQKRLADIFGSALTPNDQSRVIILFTESGAIKHATALMNNYFDIAEKSISDAPLSIEYKKEFQTLAQFLRGRSS